MFPPTYFAGTYFAPGYFADGADVQDVEPVTPAASTKPGPRRPRELLAIAKPAPVFAPALFFYTGSTRVRLRYRSASESAVQLSPVSFAFHGATGVRYRFAPAAGVAHQRHVIAGQTRQSQFSRLDDQQVLIRRLRTEIEDELVAILGL